MNIIMTGEEIKTEEKTPLEQYILERLKEVDSKFQRAIDALSWYEVEMEEDKVRVKTVGREYGETLIGKIATTFEDLIENLALATERRIFDFLISQLEEFIEWEDDDTTIYYHAENLGNYGEFITACFKFKVKPQFAKIFEKLKKEIEEQTNFRVAGYENTVILYAKVTTIAYKRLGYAQVATTLKDIKSWIE